MKKVSLMMLGGGKRLSLLQSFQEAAHNLNIELIPYSYEIDEFQPIGSVSKIIVGKKWTDPYIEEDLIDVVNKNDIDLIISNVDPATLIHAKLKGKITAASISSELEATKICLDKNLFQNACVALGLKVIPRAKRDEYPQFLKPLTGSASKGVAKINSEAEITEMKEFGDYILQEYIEGQEYTVDAYVSLSGEILGVSPRKRLQTLGGESVVTETIESKELNDFSVLAINAFGLRGPLTLQFIKSNLDGELFLMEINPRFGGAVLASIEAGFNFPSMMLEEITGGKPIKVTSGKRLVMKRYFKEVYFEANN
jgi:carbamoyl-phosphate synthase large subunit